MTVSIGQTVDIGHGRGRLAPVAAASIVRLDADLGRPADINSAWRDPVLQQQLYDAWVAYSRYLAGGPWAPKAPRALKPSESVHCDGEAADSDDWYNAAAAAKWRDHGWRQTARTSNKTTDEPWHGEHFAHLDNHRNETAGKGSRPFEPPAPPRPMEENNMHAFRIVNPKGGLNGVGFCAGDGGSFYGCHAGEADRLAQWLNRTGAPFEVSEADALLVLDAHGIPRELNGQPMLTLYGFNWSWAKSAAGAV